MPLISCLKKWALKRFRTPQKVPGTFYGRSLQSFRGTVSYRMTKIVITRFAEKQLIKLPLQIREALQYWAETVSRVGILETRKLKGYHDEPLKGERKGQRSIRLNKAYRAIYIETISGVEICVIEVNKHDY